MRRIRRPPNLHQTPIPRFPLPPNLSKIHGLHLPLPAPSPYHFLPLTRQTHHLLAPRPHLHYQTPHRLHPRNRNRIIPIHKFLLRTKRHHRRYRRYSRHRNPTRLIPTLPRSPPKSRFNIRNKQYSTSSLIFEIRIGIPFLRHHHLHRPPKISRNST